jgi:hypothetical protein
LLLFGFATAEYPVRRTLLPPKHTLNFYAVAGRPACTWRRLRTTTSSTAASSSTARAGAGRSATATSPAKRIVRIDASHVRPLAELEESRPATKDLYLLVHHRRFE